MMFLFVGWDFSFLFRERKEQQENKQEKDALFTFTRILFSTLPSFLSLISLYVAFLAKSIDSDSKIFHFFSLKTRDWLQLIKRKQKKIGNSSSVLNFRFTYRSISSSFSLGVLFILRIMIDRWCHSFLCTDKKQKIQINKQQSN